MTVKPVLRCMTDERDLCCAEAAEMSHEVSKWLQLKGYLRSRGIREELKRRELVVDKMCSFGLR